MNISKQNDDGNDDGVSMYLSFDNTATSDSTSTYKTIGCDDLTSFSDLIDAEDSKGNTTLHNTNKTDELSGIMKDCISVAAETLAPSLMFPKMLKDFNARHVSSTPSKIEIPVEKVLSLRDENVDGDMKDCRSSATDIKPQPQQLIMSRTLKEFNAVSSTPSEISTHPSPVHTVAAPLMFPSVLKDFNARHVSSTPSKMKTSTEEVPSPAKALFELSHKPLERGSADLSAVFNNLVSEYEQENKENPLPSSSDDTMPSFSQTSILQLQNQKLNSHIPTPQPASGSEPNSSASKSDIESVLNSIKEYKIVTPIKRQLTPYKTGAVDSIKKSEKLSRIGTPKKKLSIVNTEIEVYNTLPSKDVGKIDLRQNKVCIESTLESIKEHKEPTKAVFKLTGDKKAKMNSAVRKTICEPNLLTNRPSRILGDKRNRFSMAVGDQHIGDSAFRNAPAPSLLPSTSSLSNTSETLMPANAKAYKTRYATDDESNRKTSGAIRKSIAANFQNEKRPTPKRMPPIVKTTLNCATRKTTRPSISANGNITVKRRSVLLLPSKTVSSPRKRKSGVFSESSSNDRFMAHVSKNANTADRLSPTRRNVNSRKTLYAEKSEALKFICADCGASFYMKSSLDAHKKTHRVRAASPDFTKKPPRALGGYAGNNGVTASNTLSHQCKFCDKMFVLERALHIHLLEHCPKIPAIERRKLNFTEMDHVKKEETPHFRAASARTTTKPPAAFSSKDPLSHLPVRKSAEISKTENYARALAGGDKRNQNESKYNTQNHSPSRQAANKPIQMAPPQSTKVKKRSAQGNSARNIGAGVYRTPNKDIPCVSCKQSFKSVLDYTNHMMATHAALDASLNSLNGNVE